MSEETSVNPFNPFTPSLSVADMLQTVSGTTSEPVTASPVVSTVLSTVLGTPFVAQTAISSTKDTTVAVNPVVTNSLDYKYNEDDILAEFKTFVDATYTGHYQTETQDVECFDAWIALGDSGPTFRNTALKYLWRYGKKEGNNKKDLFKALHYIMMVLYVDHFKDF